MNFYFLISLSVLVSFQIIDERNEFSFQSVLTNMSIVAGNGIFWPYAVIWASSQARKETISFLRKIRLSIITCNFKHDSQSGLQQRVQAIKDWKDNERRSKTSGKGKKENISDDDEKINQPEKPTRHLDVSTNYERATIVRNGDTKNFSAEIFDDNPISIPRDASGSFLENETPYSW